MQVITSRCWWFYVFVVWFMFVSCISDVVNDNLLYVKRMSQISSAASRSRVTRRTICRMWSVAPPTSSSWARTVRPDTSCSTACWERGSSPWARRWAGPVGRRAGLAGGGSCASHTAVRHAWAWRCRGSMSWCISWRRTADAGTRFRSRTWRSRSARIPRSDWPSWRSRSITPCCR